nr:unnamed protein product [Callosobruchus chinensis]
MQPRVVLTKPDLLLIELVYFMDNVLKSVVLITVLYLLFIIYGWTNNTIHIFIHLVPQGTPNLLIPFIVLIESIRNIIRPGTLSIRLSANIIAGHLLITLIGRTGTSLNIIIINILILTQILLLILETAVSIIQSYVFTVLRTLYSRETMTNSRIYRNNNYNNRNN